MLPSKRPLTLCEILLEEAVEMTSETEKSKWQARLDKFRSSRSDCKNSEANCADTAEQRERVFGELHELGRSALCFSGGGIRSATFGLGALQGLAQLSNRDGGPLRSLDFISTVSGGGYLGGWLTRWRE